MSYKTYKVRVFDDGDKIWYLNEYLHREDGPAVEYTSGSKEWWLDGIRHTETEWRKKLNKDTCDGEVVEIKGKKYKLVKM